MSAQYRSESVVYLSDPGICGYGYAVGRMERHHTDVSDHLRNRRTVACRRNYREP